MKIRYDIKHKSLLHRIENRVYLKFYKEYEVIEQHKKLKNQRCKWFLIKRRVNRLAYELNISLWWKIHSIISIVQLKSILFMQDSYNCVKSNHSESMYVENDTKTDKSYEMEIIIDKRVRKFERTSMTQYKIKWLNYD